MSAYKPASFHNGSVWPHDSAIAAAGLMGYGFVEKRRSSRTPCWRPQTYFGGRLPELFCGLDRAIYPVPGPYPASCSPQAWASAAPVHLIRVLLRFDPLGWEDAPASIQTERPVTTITEMCSRIAQAADRRGRQD